MPRIIGLVAAREYRMRVRSRAFVLSTLVLMASVVAMVVLTAVLQDEDSRRSVDIGVVDPSPALHQALVDTGDVLDTDVVVTDLAMPGMNGFEVLPKILALDANAHVVILTADTQSEAKRRCISAGAKGVLNKPVNAEQLDAVIRAGLPTH